MKPQGRQAVVARFALLKARSRLGGENAGAPSKERGGVRKNGGETGIRTLGTQRVHWFSKPTRSTAPASLRSAGGAVIGTSDDITQFREKGNRRAQPGPAAPAPAMALAEGREKITGGPGWAAH